MGSFGPALMFFFLAKKLLAEKNYDVKNFLPEHISGRKLTLTSLDYSRTVRTVAHFWQGWHPCCVSSTKLYWLVSLLRLSR